MTWDYCKVYLEVRSGSMNFDGYYATSRAWHMTGFIHRQGDDYPIQKSDLATIEVTGFENDDIVPFVASDHPKYLEKFIALLELENWELVEVDYENCVASMRQPINSH